MAESIDGWTRYVHKRDYTILNQVRELADGMVELYGDTTRGERITIDTATLNEIYEPYSEEKHGPVS